MKTFHDINLISSNWKNSLSKEKWLYFSRNWINDSDSTSIPMNNLGKKKPMIIQFWVMWFWD